MGCLYRGVNVDLDKRNEGKLIPNTLGKPFESHALYGDAYYGDGSVYGASESNIIIQHQRDSSRYESSGISTTPNLENARRYATNDGKYPCGYVYVIDEDRLADYGVSAYHVDEYATQPAIPGDKEVILVADNNGALPGSIIIDKQRVP